MKILFQIDHDDRIRPAGDTSFALMLEAQARGFEIWRAHPSDLYTRSSDVWFKASRVTAFDREADFFETHETAHVPLDQFDFLLIRQDPPFDQSYMANVQMLAAQSSRTKILNAPDAILSTPEKISALRFSDYIPRTVITSDIGLVREAFSDFNQVVIKSLYDGGGEAVARLTLDDPDAAETFNQFVATYHNGPIIVQEFLPDVVKGDKRAVMINGKLEGVLLRVPQDNDFRANIHVGGTGKLAELTDREKEICAAVTPYLKDQNIYLAGLDLLADHLIEINVTSPTLFREIKALGGVDLARIFWDGLL